MAVPLDGIVNGIQNKLTELKTAIRNLPSQIARAFGEGLGEAERAFEDVSGSGDSGSGGIVGDAARTAEQGQRITVEIASDLPGVVRTISDNANLPSP